MHGDVRLSGGCEAHRESDLRLGGASHRCVFAAGRLNGAGPRINCGM